MDVFPNSGASRKPEPGACKDEFLPGLNAGGGEDVSLEWLSMYMEDCFSATPSYNFTPQPNPAPTNTNTNNDAPPQSLALALPPQSKDKKRKSTHKTQALQDPPLLHQTHWLADSELIYPKREYEHEEQSAVSAGGEVEVLKGIEGGQQHRRCTHCLSQKTPQWRAGPEGPKTLCNACGVRFKSGRLLPEYRPAKSPTFVSYKHSNSHKKVMEMRRGFMPSTSK